MQTRAGGILPIFDAISWVTLRVEVPGTNKLARALLIHVFAIPERLLIVVRLCTSGSAQGRRSFMSKISSCRRMERAAEVEPSPPGHRVHERRGNRFVCGVWRPFSPVIVHVPDCMCAVFGNHLQAIGVNYDLMLLPGNRDGSSI